MDYSTYECVDAGTENCPCYLALTGDCLTCSRLAGKDACDCNWRGVCIYNEFKQGNGRVNNPRREFTAGLIRRKLYLDDLAVFVLDVGKGFAIKCAGPGSYIFMRRPEDSRFYDVPISIMHADVEGGQIHVAVKIISAKTKNLLAEKEAFVLRGVYRNGILGLDAIKPRNLKNASVLLVAKGIGLAPAILTAEALCRRNQVDLVVDTEKISTQLVSDYLGNYSGDYPGECSHGCSAERRGGRLRGNPAAATGKATGKGTGKTLLHETAETRGEAKPRRVRYLTLSSQEDRRTLRDMIEEERYDSAAVLASDYYVEQIGGMIKELLPQAGLAVSNNFRICCGEGICGACSVTDAGGETLKMCKCQVK